MEEFFYFSFLRIGVKTLNVTEGIFLSQRGLCVTEGTFLSQRGHFW